MTSLHTSLAMILVTVIIKASIVAGCMSDSDCGGVSGSCTISINDLKYCSKCATEKVPINGRCVSANDAQGNVCSAAGCTRCTKGYFLHYGSCFNISTDSAGSLVCDFVDDENEQLVDGYCTQCSQDGYTDNPKKSSTTQSCIACFESDGTSGCNLCTAIPDDGSAGGFMVICHGCADRDKVAIDNKCVPIGGVEDALSGCVHSTSSGSTYCNRCGAGFLQFASTCLLANGNYAPKICEVSNQIHVADTICCKQCKNTGLAIIDGDCSDFNLMCTCSGGRCTQCAEKKFVYHYGGCYHRYSTLARSICSGDVDVGGRCLQCNTSTASGLFTNPTANDMQACVSCSDTARQGIANCVECSYAQSTLTCTKCSDGSVPQNNHCNAVTPPGPPEGGCSILACKTCNTTDTTRCAVCHMRTYLALDNKTCVSNCSTQNSGDNHYYGNSATGACEKCHSSCRTCVGPGENQCTDCAPEQYVPGSVGNCIACSSTQSGSTFTGIPNCIRCYKGGYTTTELKCSACTTGMVPNFNQARCISSTSCSTKNCELCQTDPSTCDRCQENFFLAPDGSCVSDCATLGPYIGNTQTRKCIHCGEGCMSCNSDLYCISCQSTYAIVNNRYCFKCDSTDSGSLIMGVPNCTKCKAPSIGHGPVHCLEYSSQPQNETGSRSNATGIAVGVTIAILAIAGVIGFLVWWFVCKKKTNKVNMPPKLSSNSSIVSSRIGLM